MKTPEEYIMDYWGEIKNGCNERGESLSQYDVEKVIQYAITDAYNQAVKDAAENVEISFPEYLDGNKVVYKCAIEDIVVDKNSILKLLKE